jgi:hypothetical protein
MGAVPTSDFSLGNLLQTLTSTDSPQLSAVLSSPTVQTALQTAPSGDVAEMVELALQLEESSLLFENSNTAGVATLPAVLDSLSSLASSTLSTAAPGSSTAPLANQLSGYQSELQSEEMQALFGVAPTGPPPSTLFDAIG